MRDCKNFMSTPCTIVLVIGTLVFFKSCAHFNKIAISNIGPKDMADPANMVPNFAKYIFFLFSNIRNLILEPWTHEKTQYVYSST